jgi:hypothetical protein
MKIGVHNIAEGIKKLVNGLKGLTVDDYITVFT